SDAETLGGLEIDHQLELRRLLNGQVPRLGTLENLIDILDRSVHLVCVVHPVGDKTAGIGKRLLPRDYWQPSLRSHGQERLSMSKEQRGIEQIQRLGVRPAEG